MDEAKTMGIYCLKDRTFYYMENGPATTHMDLDRLRTILIGRDLIKPAGIKQPRTYDVMSLADARMAGHELTKIYLNKHIEGALKAKHVEEVESPWS